MFDIFLKIYYAYLIKMTDFGEYKHPAYDNVPIEEREETLRRFVFGMDILKPNGFLERERIKGEILDLGCGRGAVGAVLKRINPEVVLTGVDVRTDYRGSNFLGLYEEIIEGEAADIVKSIVEKGERKFDAVISVGLPGYEIDKLIGSEEIFGIVKSGGFILLTTDLIGGYFPKGTGRFQALEGTYVTDADMLYWDEKEKEHETQKI